MKVWQLKQAFLSVWYKQNNYKNIYRFENMKEMGNYCHIDGLLVFRGSGGHGPKAMFAENVIAFSLPEGNLAREMT